MQERCTPSQGFDLYSRDKFGCAWFEAKLIRREAGAVKTVVVLSGVIPLTVISQIGNDLGELCDRLFKRAAPNNR